MAISFNNELLNAYLESDYIHTRSHNILNIGSKHIEWDHFCEKRNIDTYAWITAWNPGSELLPEEENIKRNFELKHRLGTAIISEGHSQNKEGTWREQGFWVGNKDVADLLEICVAFQQNGFVFGRRGQVLQLILGRNQ